MIVPFWTRAGVLRNPLCVIAISLIAFPLVAQEHADAGESIVVERLVIDAWITAPDGAPVTDVEPADLEVLVDGRPARVEAVEFLSFSGAGNPLSPPDQPSIATEANATPARLFIYFFQTDFQRARITGQMRMVNAARELVANLLPNDLVAVVSYDSHLKLHQDFTSDREAILRAIARTLEIGETPVHVSNDREASLVAGISRDSARKAARPETALLLIARSLLDVEGHKSLIYFGWGLGRFGAGGVVMDRHWAPARQIMEEARTTMFVLDTSDADYHSLEVGLKEAAAATGGYYQATNRFAQQAIQRLQRTLSGRYEIVVVIEDMPRGVHPVQIRLRGGVRGEVWSRTSYTLR